MDFLKLEVTASSKRGTYVEITHSGQLEKKRKEKKRCHPSFRPNPDDDDDPPPPPLPP